MAKRAFVVAGTGLILLYLVLTISAAPILTRITPFFGQPGDIVTITGSGFSTAAAQNVVRFGPNRAPVLSASPTQLVVQIPNGQPLGATNVTVELGTPPAASVSMSQASNSLSFQTSYKSKIITSTNPPKCCCCPDDTESNTCGCNSDCYHGGGSTGGCSGNVYTERGEFFQYLTDLSIPGRPGSESMVNFTFRRQYRAHTNSDSPIGRNWDHNYFERLAVQIDGSVIHSNGLDRNDRYLKNNRGDLVAPPNFYTKLIRNPNGTFVLRYRGGTTKTFDTDGKILELRDRNDNFMTFHYNGQRQLVRVNDTLGRDIIYRYIASGVNNGRLQEIEDFIGRKITFTYDANGDLVGVRSPVVFGTPNGNNFPQGKTTRYTYSSGFSDERLNHNLLTITRPNEVAAGGPPVVINEYGTNAFEIDKVIRQTYGGTNASGIAAGGTFTYSYTQLNAGVQSDDPNLPVTLTRETDRNGNITEYEFNRLGYVVLQREFTRGLRPSDPPVFETRMVYNADGRLLRKTNSAGNSFEYTYDEGNPDRFQQGNRFSETRIPDARGGDQVALVTTFTYEPRFNQLKSVTDPRGNDPAFVPQNGGSTSAARYTTTYTFDYEVVGDPILNPNGFEHGNILRKQEPTVMLPGGTLQSIITEYTYNQFGQKISEIDPEGNVDEFFYHPENDPDGDGNPSPETRAGLDPTTGGYLKEKIVDSFISARRTEPTPPVRISNKYFYDPVGNMIRTIDGRGNDTLSRVNQLNQVVRTESEAPFRYVTDTFFDFNNNVVRTDIENRVASVQDGKPVFTVDGNFNTQPGSPAFFIHRYTYDILDHLIQKDEDATGSTPSRLITSYRYDANENQTREIFPEGNVFATTYDERDLVFRRIRGFGSAQASTFTYSYDQNRNLILQVDGEDNNGDGRNDETIDEYDGFDRRIRTIDAVGGRVTSNHDPNDNVVKQSRFGRVGGPSPTNNFGAGNVLLSQREFKHDELNRVFQQDDVLFVSTGVGTARPPVLTEGPLTSGDGRVSLRTIFDRNSRKVRQIQDDLDTTLMEYDGVDRMVKTTDGEANIESYTYDANNNLIQKVETERSQKAGIATETFTTTYRYDALDRLTRVSDNCQNTNRSAYDSRNNLTHETDAKADATVGCTGAVNAQGNSMRYIYDGINRRMQTIQDLRAGGIGSGALDTSNPSNSDGRITTTSTYDGNSRLSSLSDDNGNTTRYTYDALNRVTVETFADGTTKAYTYDRDDNVVRYKDNNGTIRICVYDAINRRVRCDIIRASGVVGTTLNGYEYDGLSRITRMTDNNEPLNGADDSNVTYAYDSLSRLIEELQKGKAISSDWFSADQRVGLTYPNDRKLALTFDNLDRLKTINDTGAPTNIVRYDYIGPARVLERQYQNGVRATHLDDAGTTDTGYDPIKRMVGLRHLRSDNSLVVGFTHAYDREDNKRFERKLHQPSNAELYAYDSVYRIIDFQRGQLNAANDGIVGPSQRTQGWELDGVGNWRKNIENGVVENRTANQMNEYVTVGLSNQFHDDNGNLTNDGVLGFRWDYMNRLRQVCALNPFDTDGADNIPGTGDDCQSPGALPVAAYSYDAMNRRFRKVVSNSGSLDGTTDFYYDGWRVLEERNGADAIVQQYVSGIYLDEALVLDRNLNGDGSATGPSDQRLFYHQNTLYSVFALTDTSGALVEGYQYDAYGKQTIITDGNDADAVVNFTANDVRTVGGNSTVGNPYMYTGQRFDGETALIFYKSRYYSVSLGRFLSRDPIEYNGGINLYEYVGGHPNVYTDPFGLASTSCVGVSLTFVFAGGATGGFYHCKDTCGNSAWVFLGSARFGAEFSAGFGGFAQDGCVKDLLKGGMGFDVSATGGIAAVSVGPSSGGVGVGPRPGGGVSVGIASGGGPISGNPNEYDCPCDPPKSTVGKCPTCDCYCHRAVDDPNEPFGVRGEDRHIGVVDNAKACEKHCRDEGYTKWGCGSQSEAWRQVSIPGKGKWVKKKK
ncbi:MAG TPA: RHS repeat-associated core domain-containing protein [Pyrinomonadaceae bacterium]|nr:RHS repeat-associated core domain-containing protein [Pyrinomonadaceae bacterium]